MTINEMLTIDIHYNHPYAECVANGGHVETCDNVIDAYTIVESLFTMTENEIVTDSIRVMVNGEDRTLIVLMVLLINTM